MPDEPILTKCKPEKTAPEEPINNCNQFPYHKLHWSLF